jgi:threonine/homoserine/homoserine lactone efflux protein
MVVSLMKRHLPEYAARMGRALGDVLPLAVAIAVFPVPIIAVVLLLGSEGGRFKGVAFVLAWCAGLAAVGAIVLLVAGGLDASDDGEPATWANVVVLVLGLALLAYAVKQWRGRSQGGDTPGWMRKVDEFTPAKAAGAGFALTAINPKNVLLTAAAATEIAEVGLSPARQAGVLAAFVLVASAGVLTPVAAALVLGDRSREPLDGVREWMARNNAVVMAVLFLLIGAKLVGDAISGFSS